MLHRPGFAGYVSAALFDFLACLVRIIDFDCDVAITATEIVSLGIPVMR